MLCGGSNGKHVSQHSPGEGAKPSHHGPIKLLLMLVLLMPQDPTEAPVEAPVRPRVLQTLSPIAKMHLIHSFCHCLVSVRKHR
eukprot:COSAG02_NODE_1873_length_10578_cov_50.375418_2_plen_83_part_00